MGYVEELVHTRSEDGYLLDGLLARPGAGTPKPIAVVWVHGLYASFYDAPYPQIGRELAAMGYASITGNNRGHDFGAVLRERDGRPVCGGGGWERLEECPRDIGGWVSFAVEMGYRSVVLAGHSMGARKAAFYMAERQVRRVVGLVAASPAAWRIGPPDPELAGLAQAMVSEGRGRDLLPWPTIGCSVSAQTYLDAELPGAAFRNIFEVSDAQVAEPVVARVRCPILAFFGSEETRNGESRTAELETIRRNATASARVDTLMIEGTGHSYEGRERQVAEAIVEWVESYR